MRNARIAGTDLAPSVFVFGTASLHHLGTHAAERLVAAAADSGFTHFDTAPCYGLGLSERLLQPMLRSRREAQVTTKVGLYPAFGATQSRLGMFGRKALGKLFPPLAKPVAQWAVARARRSLDESLRRLGRDHVDLLMLHEPDAALIGTDEWLAWLESERGRVRWFGLAGEPGRLLPFVQRSDPLATVLQTRDSLAGREADSLRAAGRSPQLRYGVLSAGRAPPSDLLRSALERQEGGAIIVSTRHEERLKLFGEIAS